MGTLECCRPREIQRSCYPYLALNALCTSHRTCIKHFQPKTQAEWKARAFCVLCAWGRIQLWEQMCCGCRSGISLLVATAQISNLSPGTSSCLTPPCVLCWLDPVPRHTQLVLLSPESGIWEPLCHSWLGMGVGRTHRLLVSREWKVIFIFHHPLYRQFWARNMVGHSEQHPLTGFST